MKVSFKIGNLVLFIEIFNSFCPGTSRDRGVCPGTKAPALVPGQMDTGTRISFCPGTKGQWNVPSRGNPSSSSSLNTNMKYPVTT